MAGSWPGLVLQLAIAEVWRLQTLSHGGDHSDGAGGDMTPGHMNNANKNYPDSGVTTRLGTHCSYHLLERNHF